MYGLVIVAHGGLARELLAATEHVVGAQENAIAVSTCPQDDLTEKQAEIRDAVAKVDKGDGVVVVTDMFGGTPSNLAIGCIRVCKIIPCSKLLASEPPTVTTSRS